MLRQGPVDKYDVKPCQTWELTMRSSTTYILLHYDTIEINKQLKQRSRENMRRSGWTSAEKVYFLLPTGWVHFSSFENALPIPLPSCFHPMFPCEGLLERSTGLTPEHQSTNTTKVSQVSNTTGAPLYIPFSFTVSRPGATDPSSQAPGLCSFLANFIACPIKASQVNVGQSLVDC